MAKINNALPRPGGKVYRTSQGVLEFGRILEVSGRGAIVEFQSAVDGRAGRETFVVRPWGFGGWERMGGQ